MYGGIIKKIRKGKGYTQKEVYTGVVSKTFYSDFEAGKYSIELIKFHELLKNLGISYQEFEYFNNQHETDEAQTVEQQVDLLYKNGKFEDLYALYETYKKHSNVDLRYLALHAYLLVLITNANYYKFSREPFNEIVAELENVKMWTLKEIKLSKLILLSFSEKDKHKSAQFYKRIVCELEKYRAFDSKRYYEEIGDLHFNHIQSQLVTNDIHSAHERLASYSELIAASDDLHLLLQWTFITHLVNLYRDFPDAQMKMEEFLAMLAGLPSSEVHFYSIIFQLHQEKSRNYYKRYQ